MDSDSADAKHHDVLYAKQQDAPSRLGNVQGDVPWSQIKIAQDAQRHGSDVIPTSSNSS